MECSQDAVKKLWRIIRAIEAGVAVWRLINLLESYDKIPVQSCDSEEAAASSVNK